MVDYHYIKRGNKIYGPYYYKSYRVGDKVKKEYLGKDYIEKIQARERQKALTPFLILLLFLIGMFFVITYYAGITGKASIELQSTRFLANEPLAGNLNLQLKQGELIPEKTFVALQISNETFMQEKEIELKKFVKESEIKIEESKGNYYIENTEITGIGNGYGLEGIKTIFPFVYFKLEITATEETGRKLFEQIDGSVVSGQAFVYEIRNETAVSNVNAVVVENSVYYYDETGKKEKLDENVLNIEILSNKITVTTNYSYQVQGFGSDFISENKTTITLNLSALEIAVEQAGNYNLTIILSYEDKAILQTSSTLNILPSNISINHAPYLKQEIPNQGLHANTNASINLSDYFADEDEDALTFSSTKVENIDIVIVNDTAAIIPSRNWIGTRSVKFNASDGIKENESNLVTIEVTNSPPILARILSDLNITRNRNETLNLSWYFVDADNDKLTYSSSKPDNISIEIAADMAILQPDFNFVGTRNIIFYASDAINTTSSNLVSIEVAIYKVNHAPVLISTIPNQTIYNSTEASINLAEYFIDEDGNNMTYNISYAEADNLQLSLDSETGLVKIAPETNFIGNRSVIFSASDGIATTLSNLVQIFVVEKHVERVNHAPQLLQNIPDIKINKSESAVINLADYFYDEDNDKLIYATLQVDNITILISGNITTILPDAGFVGTRETIFYATDGINITESNVVTINVTEIVPKINHAPILVTSIPNISIRKDSSYLLNLALFFRDADNDTLSFTSLETANVSITVKGNMAEIVPDKNWVGTRILAFFASDSINTTQSNSFTIEVKFVNITETTIQQEAILNQPVAWSKRIVLEEPANVTVKVPIEATNITIVEVVNKQPIEVAASLITVTGSAIRVSNAEARETNLFPAIFEKISNLFEVTRARITGQAIVNESMPAETAIDEEIQKLKEAGYKELQLELTGNATEYIINYETPAPKSTEHDVSNGKKQITISGPETVHYTNITAFTQLPEIVPINKQYALKLYHLENGIKQETPFAAYDDNSNGFIDRIEWLVPELSNQSYETSITIINVQSYPTLYGNWIVYFNTTGEADLTITAINSTTWHTSGQCGITNCQLKFVTLVCNNIELNYIWLENSADGSNNSVFYSNYSCLALSYEKSQVLSAEHHTLQFKFGSDVAYAYNEVTPPTVTLISPATNTVTAYDNATFRFQASDNIALANCTLHTNRSGAWQAELSNTTALSNGVTAEINLTGLTDDNNFDWNIKCYDNSSNFAWAVSNWTLNVNIWYQENATFLFDLKPVVNLTYPADATILAATSALFTFNITETFGLLNCSLYHNITSWGIAATNVTPQTGNNSFTIENLADDTLFEWNVVCYDTRASKSWGNETGNRTLTINLWYTENVSFKIDRPPVINWTTPANLNTSIFNLTGGFAESINVTDYSLKEMNCTIYSDVNLTKAVWSVSINITGNITYTKTSFVNTSNWQAGIYYEKCQITDIPV